MLKGDDVVGLMVREIVQAVMVIVNNCEAKWGLMLMVARIRKEDAIWQ